MRDKQELIAEIQENLNAGVLTEEDLKSFIHMPVPEPAVVYAVPAPVEEKSDKLSAVDVMFYIAGIVLYSAVMSVIGQTWGDGNEFTQVLLSAGIGAALWAVAYYLITNAVQSDVRKGLINALLLTGSLLIITGGYIISNLLIGGFEEVNFIAGAITLAVVGGIHIGFDGFIKRDLTLLTGVLLCVASFPALMFGLIQDVDAALDIWVTILIISAGLLTFATRVVAKSNSDRSKLATSFDSFAAFLALSAMYVASFGEYGVIWLAILVAGVMGIFSLSVLFQDKNLLGNASFFLVVTVITISFKYFSGFGVTTSLILATIGLLGSAAVATTINKKYFRQNEADHQSNIDY